MELHQELIRKNFQVIITEASIKVNGQIMDGESMFVNYAEKLVGWKREESKRENQSQSTPVKPSTPTFSVSAIDAEARRLSAMIGLIATERDAWRNYANSLEASMQKSAGEQDGKKFRTLKRLLAQHLHPDGATNDLDRLIRDQLFKKLWEKVEEIERG